MVCVVGEFLRVRTYLSWLAAGEEVALQNFSANTRTVLVAIIS
jgi:hypothetical protein